MTDTKTSHHPTVPQRRRRPRRTRHQWQSLISEFQHGNEDITAFCQRHDISRTSFYHWQRRLQSQAHESDLFIELSPPATSVPCWDIELELGDGMTLRMRRR